MDQINRSLIFSNLSAYSNLLEEKILLYVYNFMLASILIDFLMIFIVLKSKKKLVDNEFWIFIFLTIFLILIKIWNYYVALFKKKGFKSNKNLVCISIYSLTSINMDYYMILLFYSLFHLSIIRQTKIFQILFRLTRSQKILFFYTFSTFLLSYIVIWISQYFDQNNRFVFDEKKSICNQNENLNLSIILINQLFISVIPFLTGFIYIIIIILILFKQKSKQFFKTSIKFLIFSLFSLLMPIHSLVFIFYYIYTKSLFFKLLFSFIGILSLFQLFFHSIILLLIHKVIKQNLYDFFRTNFRKYSL